MRFRKTFHTIDTHTGGEPTRNVIGGIPFIPGSTMEEKMLYMRDHKDWVRRTLTYEPRGNDVMSGTVITPPCDSRADLGVLFFEVGGWMPMCGHDTIGVATALIESGMVEVSEPETSIILDTAAGLVALTIKVEDGSAKSVTFTNAPAMVLKQDVSIQSPKYGEIKLDIAYGGNIYAILPASTVGLSLNPENNSVIIEVGNHIKKLVNKQVSVVHPELTFMDHVTHVEFYENPSDPGKAIRNAVVIPPGAIDRSPCGTGTSAKLAVLYAKGLLQINELFIHESIIGSRFQCRIIDTTVVAGIPSVIPEITGQAHITGIHTYVIDPDDPFPNGFKLG